MRNKDETKSADFIDLDKNEFKKKRGFLLKLIFLILLFLGITLIIFVISRNYSKFVSNNSTEERLLKKNSELLSKIKQLELKVEENNSTIINTIQRIDKNELDITNNQTETLTNLDILNEIKNQNFQNPNLEIQKSEVESDINLNYSDYILFDKFSKKFLSGSNYSNEEDLLIISLKKSRPEVSWENKFNSLKQIDFKSQTDLVDMLNKLIISKKTLSFTEKFDDKISRKPINSIDGLKNYFIDAFSSLISVKKVDQDSLTEISNYNEIQERNLQLAKEFLLIGNVKKTIQTLVSQNNFMEDEDVKGWLLFAKSHIEINNQIEKLKKEIFGENLGYIR